MQGDDLPLQVGEHRWQMVVAALVALGIHQLLPDTFRLAPLWLYPGTMSVFLVLLIAVDRGRRPRASLPATAFSPTDVSAIKRWAKLLMILESTVSLALATLVVATAINSIGS